MLKSQCIDKREHVPPSVSRNHCTIVTHRNCKTQCQTALCAEGVDFLADELLLERFLFDFNHFPDSMAPRAATATGGANDIVVKRE